MCSLDVSVLDFSHFLRTQQVHNLDNMGGKEMTHHLHKLREHYQQSKYLKEYWYFINFHCSPTWFVNHFSSQSRENPQSMCLNHISWFKQIFVLLSAFLRFLVGYFLQGNNILFSNSWRFMLFQISQIDKHFRKSHFHWTANKWRLTHL